MVGFNTKFTGASTITQQVAKNFFLTSDRTISRKVKEAILALRLERSFSKKHIMTLYLNEIFLGARAYGVGSAALMYFNKPVKDLTLSECAFLASLPKAPNDRNRAEERREMRDKILACYDDQHRPTIEEWNRSFSINITLN